LSGKDGFVRDVMAIDSDLSGGWSEKAGEHAQSGAFAGAVGPKKPDDFAFFDVKRDVTDGPK
jgi:hypothetical protein